MSSRTIRRLAAGFLAAFLLPAAVAAQSGAVRGTVLDTSGKGIKGATIRASNPSGHPPQLTATSDDRGRFVIIGLSGGSWIFVVEAPGYAPQRGAANIRSTTTGNAPLGFVLEQEAPVPAGVVTREVQTDIVKADALRDAGHLGDAIAEYERIASQNPALTMMGAVIGAAYRQQAQRTENQQERQALLDKGIAAYQRALEDEPDSDRVRIELALTQLQRGHTSEAERTLGGATAADADGRLVQALGEVKLGQGDVAAAEALFRRALDIDPDSLRPKLQLGLIAYRSGNRPSATALLKEVIAEGGTGPEAAEAQRYLDQLMRY